MPRPFLVASSLVVLAAAASLGGCNKSPRDKLQGKWVGETVGQVHASQQGQAETWAKNTHLEFAGNKVTVSVPAESPRSGTFKIAKVDGNEMDLLFKRPEGSEDKTRVRMNEDGKMVWMLGGTEMVMRREQ